MRNAELALSVIRDRGTRGLHVEDLYRQLFNPDLYLRAYARLYKNQGAMTKGTTGETVDGMSMAKIERLIDDVRHERHRWTPVRRTYIPKSNGKVRPLGIPTWTDKLLQEAVRSILEAYYEPRFSAHSHGFRPDRGCHTALTEVHRTWLGTKWFIEGDIKGCFDNIDHQVLLETLRVNLHDNRFMRLIEGLLQAGYLEEWRVHPTLSGTPQGGVVSPILANIYLDRLDQYVETVLAPEYNRGERRQQNLEYKNLRYRRRRAMEAGRSEEAKELLKQIQRTPSTQTDDPSYRRLRYVRYADDFLLGFIGPKHEAEEIKARIAEFLGETLKLTLSAEKTLVTHATDQAARFLGYEIVAQREDTVHDALGRRALSGKISLRLPEKVLRERCALYCKDGKPIHRPEIMHETEYSIVARYQSEYRGYVQYYKLAHNIYWLNRLQWTMGTSLLKTLANKRRESVAQVAQRLKDTIQTPAGPRTCLKVTVEREGKKPLVTYFGGIPLKRDKQAIVTDTPPVFGRTIQRNELLARLLADECEACGSDEDVEVHHVRKLADLNKRGRRPKPQWAQMMAARQRKTLVLCRKCHDDLHAGRPIGGSV